MPIFYMVVIFQSLFLSLVPTVFPTYQGNPLVFVTPTLLEAGMTGVAVIIGALVERGIISRRRERI